jgi:hypothetical protein
MCLRNCGNFKTAKKAWLQQSKIYKLQIRKSLKILGPQIRKMQHLRKVHKFADLRLKNLLEDRPPLVLTHPFKGSINEVRGGSTTCTQGTNLFNSFHESAIAPLHVQDKGF